MSFNIEAVGQKATGFFHKYGTIILIGGGAVIAGYFFLGGGSSSTTTVDPTAAADTADATATQTDSLNSFMSDMEQSIQEAQQEQTAANTATQELITTNEAAQNKYMSDTATAQKNQIDKLTKQLNKDTDAIDDLTKQLSKSKSSSSSGSSGSHFTKYNGKTSSIVTALQNHNISSSLSYRKKIAEANGISNYRGSASQNKKMLSLFKSGKLKKPKK